MTLQNTNFSIISNNCWGGYVYQEQNLPYQSPFVGLFLYAKDYYKLVSHFRYYMTKELTFREELEYFAPGDYYYPIGQLGDLEIHFLHYKTKEEAFEKWNRRKERLNYDNLYFKFDNRDGADADLLKKIDQLPYQNKIIFVNRPEPDLESSVYIPGQEASDAIFLMPNVSDYFDVISWLNKGGNALPEDDALAEALSNS